MIIFIQARYSSNRLYGKVLKKILNKPLIGWMIDRIRKSNLKIPIVVLTSLDNSDDLIEDYCKSIGINFFRGNLYDVASRFIAAGDFFNEDKCIRLCGDSPLIDPQIIKDAIELSFENPQFDLITNIQKRTFPKGQSVEIVNMKSLKKLYQKNLSKDEQEHVTLGFYNRNDDFRIINFESKNNIFQNIQLSIDTQDDFDSINLIFNHFSSTEELLKSRWDQLALIYNDININSKR